MVDREVRDTNGLNLDTIYSAEARYRVVESTYLARVQERDHGLPRIHQGHLRIEDNPSRPVRVLRLEALVEPGRERDGPVHHCSAYRLSYNSSRAESMRTRTVEIEVLELELLERLVELLLDFLRAVRRVPQLRRDKELLALHDGRNDLLQRATDLRTRAQFSVTGRLGSRQKGVPRPGFRTPSRSRCAGSPNGWHAQPTHKTTPRTLAQFTLGRREGLTARSTSFGFESQVPSPICGIVAPVESASVFPNDISFA